MFGIYHRWLKPCLKALRGVVGEQEAIMRPRLSRHCAEVRKPPCVIRRESRQSFRDYGVLSARSSRRYAYRDEVENQARKLRYRFETGADF
ncbi:hypothetical protein D3C87_659970 [compost metagenome]